MTNIPTFKLDPCFACRQRYDITDINNINSCCSDTASAFAGESSLNALIGTDAGLSCKNCLNESKQALGKSDCVLRLTNSPVWTQVPHYFPHLFAQSGNKEKALDACYKSCDGRYAKECMDKCLIDYNAVIMTNEKYENTPNKVAGESQAIQLADMEKERRIELESEVASRKKPIIAVEGFKFLCDGDKCKSGYTKWIIVIAVALLLILTLFVLLRKK